MARSGKVYLGDRLAGIVGEDEDEYSFTYDPAFMQEPGAQAVSVSLPLRTEPYRDRTLFPFFDGLIPEGWLLDIAARTWKLDPRDRMGLLLTCCEDCIGAVSVKREDDGSDDGEGGSV